jgi:hypothetical protein
MRRRRAERCLVKAEVALEAGFLDDARGSIEEARRLDAATPGLDDLHGRVLLASLRADASPAPSRGRRRLLVAGACAALTVGAAFAWLTLAPAEAPTTAGEAAPAPAPLGADARVPARPDVVGIRHEDVVARVTTYEPAPRLTQTTLTAPTVAPDESTASAPPSVSSEITGAPDLPVIPLAMPEALPASPPPPVVPAMRNIDSSSPVESAYAPPPAPSAPAPVDERARVRSVLSRYEAAYSGLDASAARAVWPGVNERALAQAFDALRSQSLSLGRCDVEVSGSIARAECAGSASWTPKIGTGRTEPRRWAFDLRNASGSWQIVRAQVH